MRAPVGEKKFLRDEWNVFFKSEKFAGQRNGLLNSRIPDHRLMSIDRYVEVQERSGGVLAFRGIRNGLKRRAGLDVGVEPNRGACERELKMRVAARACGVTTALISLAAYRVLVFENEEGRIRRGRLCRGAKRECNGEQETPAFAADYQSPQIVIPLHSTSVKMNWPPALQLRTNNAGIALM
jgi:hypothetical protein